MESGVTLFLEDHNGKLESAIAWEKFPFPQNLYKVKATESGHGPGQGHRKWLKTLIGAESMYKYLYTHTYTLKFSNGVLVRVPINNYNYEQPIELFVILLAKTPSRWCNSM